MEDENETRSFCVPRRKKERWLCRERESNETLQEGIATCKVYECSRKQSWIAKIRSRTVRINVDQQKFQVDLLSFFRKFHLTPWWF